MNSKFRWTLLLGPLLALFVACGGSGDDADDSSDRANDKSSDKTNNSGSTSGSKSNSKKKVTIPDFKEGEYSSGKATIEVTGDKRQTISLDGAGVFLNGILLLNYNSGDQSLLITLTKAKGEEPGGLFLTTKEISSGGAWGEACEFNAETSGDKITGDFLCDNIEAIDLKAVKTYKVTLKGKFSAGR